MSLLEAQKNFATFGAIEQRFASDVSPPTENQPLDPTFRRIASTDNFEAPDESAPWPDDLTTLYYFRPTFWRRVVN